MRAVLICKICGKEYPVCDCKTPKGTFRWQDVACCKEHGAEYLARILASRQKQEPSSEAASDSAEQT